MQPLADTLQKASLGMVFQGRISVWGKIFQGQKEGRSYFRGVRISGVGKNIFSGKIAGIFYEQLEDVSERTERR